jgi:hypothetical protein
MDTAANAAYDKLQSGTEVVGLVTRPWFYEAFSELRVGATTDFKLSSWFYSLLALLCQKALMLVGIKLSIHASFLALHAVLIGGTIGAAYHYYRLRGAAVMLLLIFGSPLLWYLDKVHTEPFTLCLLFVGMMQMHRQRYAAASWLFALVSTQNPSFALIAGIPWAYRVLLQWRQRFTASELVLLALAAVTVLLHPAYYEMRYGVVTPQRWPAAPRWAATCRVYVDHRSRPRPAAELAAGQRRAAGRRRAVVRRRRSPEHQGSAWHEVAFVVAYVLINFYAQSSTSNSTPAPRRPGALRAVVHAAGVHAAAVDRRAVPVGHQTRLCRRADHARPAGPGGAALRPAHAGAVCDAVAPVVPDPVALPDAVQPGAGNLHGALLRSRRGTRLRPDRRPGPPQDPVDQQRQDAGRDGAQPVPVR